MPSQQIRNKTCKWPVKVLRQYRKGNVVPGIHKWQIEQPEPVIERRKR